MTAGIELTLQRLLGAGITSVVTHALMGLQPMPEVKGHQDSPKNTDGVLMRLTELQLMEPEPICLLLRSVILITNLGTLLTSNQSNQSDQSKRFWSPLQVSALSSSFDKHRWICLGAFLHL